MLKRMDELKVGDVILGEHGERLRVGEAYDIHIPEKMFALELENGETVKASGNHLWYVETDFDIQYHQQRRKDGRKALAKVSDHVLGWLEKSAENSENSEISLDDMANVVSPTAEPDIVAQVIRVAESIGHIAENNTSYEILDNDETLTQTIRTYDRRRFSQQLLSLTGKRKFRQKYPLIVGRVIPTTELVEIYEQVNIPTLKKL